MILELSCGFSFPTEKRSIARNSSHLAAFSFLNCHYFVFCFLFLFFLCVLCCLFSSQDSAAVQILLEICLPTEDEKTQGSNTYSLLKSVQSTSGPKSPELEEEEDSLLCNLREVQCLICCLLHQMYIADPNIVKLVHFQVWFALF